MSLLNLTPRDYQKAIFKTTMGANTLVVLPTGLGKTLIALMLVVERQKAFPGSKALFLAPTRPLVEQHLNYFKKNLPELFATLEIFTGSVDAEKRRKLFQRADIIFSTPQCIANDLKSCLYSLDEVSLIIIDEAHRCLKNYSYTYVVNKYKEQAKNQRILGLTASPGSDSEIVREICRHLDIKEIELRTRDSADVAPYLQNLDFTKTEVDFPKEFLEIKVLLQRIFDGCVDKLRSRNLLFGVANKIILLKLQGNLFSRMQQKDFNALIGVSLTAQAIKISHALELLETQTLSGLSEYLNSLIKQAEEKKSKAVVNLVNSGEFKAALLSLKRLQERGIEHPKINALYELINSELKENKNAKFIVFTQFRETASTISLNLSRMENARPSVFVGQAKKTNSSGSKTSGLNQKEQKEIIEKFKSGDVNILIATSIGEEGLDIPEVSAVIFYEPIPSAIRKIQRAGRTARLAPGKLFILITKDTRDVAHHYASAARERKMHRTIGQIKDELKTQNKTKTLDYFRS
jgi:Fanconi anemia group M protein